MNHFEITYLLCFVFIFIYYPLFMESKHMTCNL